MFTIKTSPKANHISGAFGLTGKNVTNSISPKMSLKKENLPGSSKATGETQLNTKPPSIVTDQTTVLEKPDGSKTVVVESVKVTDLGRKKSAFRINPYNLSVLIIALVFFQWDAIKAYWYHTGLLGHNYHHILPSNSSAGAATAFGIGSETELLVGQLTGCSSIKVHPSSASPDTAYVACSAHVENRKQWLPWILNCINSRAIPRAQDIIHVVDLKSGKAKPLVTRQFNGLLNVGRFDTFISEDNSRNVYLQVINYHPLDVAGGALNEKGQAPPRTRPSVEIFSHKVGTADLVHVETITDELIKVPTAILATGPSSFFVLNQRGALGGLSRIWDEITRGVTIGAGDIVFRGSDGSVEVVQKGIKSPTSLAWATHPERQPDDSIYRRLLVTTGCDGKILEFQTNYSSYPASQVMSFSPTGRVIGRLHYCVLDIAVAPAPLESTRRRRAEQREHTGLKKELDVFADMGDAGDLTILVTGTQSYQPVFGGASLLSATGHTRVTRIIPHRTDQRNFGKFWDREIVYEVEGDGLQGGSAAIAIDEKRGLVFLGSFGGNGIVKVKNIKTREVPEPSVISDGIKKVGDYVKHMVDKVKQE